jgi:signal peptidase I
MMKPTYIRSALTSIALLAAAAGGYLVGIHDGKDVITFTPTRSGYVKRVVGKPGDRLEFRRGVVFLNGVRLDEPGR